MSVACNIGLQYSALVNGVNLNRTAFEKSLLGERGITE